MNRNWKKSTDKKLSLTLDIYHLGRYNENPPLLNGHEKRLKNEKE